jgi:hypothetical protein
MLQHALRLLPHCFFVWRATFWPLHARDEEETPPRALRAICGQNQNGAPGAQNGARHFGAGAGLTIWADQGSVPEPCRTGFDRA